MSHLVIAAGPVHTQAVLMSDHGPEHLFAEPFARGPRPGDLYGVCVGPHVRGADGCVVEMGNGVSGFLARPKGLKSQDFISQFPEGRIVAAEVISPTRPGKRARLRPASVAADAVGLMRAAPHGWLGEVARAVGPVERVTVNRADLLPSLRALFPQADVDHHTARVPIFDHYDLREVFAEALEPVWPLACGGRVIWHPTAAGHCFDVDTAGANRRQANVQAVASVLDRVRLLNLEGLMMVGFVPDSDGQNALRDQVLQADLGLTVGRLDRLGVMSMTRARQGLAVDEVVLQPTGWGYGLRAEVTLQAAYEAWQRESAARPGVRLRLHLAPSVMAAFLRAQAQNEDLQAMPVVEDAMVSTYGVREMSKDDIR